jgi:fructokinase
MTQPQIFLGIDLGGSKREIVALNIKGMALYNARTVTPSGIPANKEHQYTDILQTIKQLVDDCESKLNQTQLPLGIGIPGPISSQTGLVKNANTTCLIGQDLLRDLSTLLKRPIKIENDANCFALSEAIDGAGKEYGSVLAIILGTGVGGGWVINKTLHIGANGIGGEWGHNSLPWSSDLDEPQQTCYFGKLGCIETYLSGPGFSKQTQLQFNLRANCPDIIQQMSYNPVAKKSYERYVDRLARSLASIINIMDPEVIILGGGLSNIASLYKDVPAAWKPYIFSDTVNTQLLKNEYGDSSGVRGAAWLNKRPSNG